VPSGDGNRHVLTQFMNYSLHTMGRSESARRLACGLLGGLGALLGVTLAMPPAASADAVAYLVNVTVRPGYNFANADTALAYGRGVCDKVAAGERYSQLVGEIQNDFNTSDYYQAAYLINQSVNELCPAQIFQLRNSAANYTLPPGS
jgi:hypothetical protein